MQDMRKRGGKRGEMESTHLRPGCPLSLCPFVLSIYHQQRCPHYVQMCVACLAAFLGSSYQFFTCRPRHDGVFFFRCRPRHHLSDGVVGELRSVFGEDVRAKSERMQKWDKANAKTSLTWQKEQWTPTPQCRGPTRRLREFP